MIKYIFFTTGARPWYDLASRLHDEAIATPVLWIGDPRHEKSARQKFGNSVVHSMDMLVHFPWRVAGNDYAGNDHQFFTSTAYYRAKDCAIKMMDRLDVYGTFSRIDREVYFKNICIWGLVTIAKAAPDLLITTESPHSHAQYALYEIAKYLGIPCYKLKPWPIVPLLTLESLDDGSLVSAPVSKQHEIHQRVRSSLAQYVNGLTDLHKKHNYETEYLKVQRRSSSLPGRLKRYVSKPFLRLWGSRIYHRLKFARRGEYSPISPSFVNLLFAWLLVNAKRTYLNRNYAAHCDSAPNLKCPYVYFGLHYEPERNTNPDGHEFHDQVLALIKLRSILPEDVQIYVKEHPSQLYKSMRGHQGRSPLFYAQLKNIKGISLIGMEVHSMTLMRNALFVSTITGSLGNEAAILGKLALIFGDAWYAGMPNVVQWKEGLAYEDLIARPISSPEQVVAFLLAQFEANYALGCHNTSGENRFRSYLSPEFRKLESEELFALFSNLFNSVGPRVTI
jgi:hypothetical protein